jgi:hypothetical protein
MNLEHKYARRARAHSNSYKKRPSAETLPIGVLSNTGLESWSTVPPTTVWPCCTKKMKYMLIIICKHEMQDMKTENIYKSSLNTNSIWCNRFIGPKNLINQISKCSSVIPDLQFVRNNINGETISLYVSLNFLCHHMWTSYLKTDNYKIYATKSLHHVDIFILCAFCDNIKIM